MRTIFGALLLGAALTLTSAAGIASHAHAQMPTMPTTVSPDVKGTVGCGLLGAEIGFAVPAAIGIKELWPYIVFPIVGGAGGALAGYFGVEQGTKSPELAVAMLIAGMVLVIPTMVLVLARTAYSPDDDAASHAAPTGGSNAPAPATAPTSLRERTHLASVSSGLGAAGGGFFRLDGQGFYLGVPSFGLTNTFSLDEIRENGLRASDQSASLRVAVLSGSF